ncbi:hypothetical protein HK102_002354 [Quaeritorhiza haematococci]|nr:hypothetical protein HK102_002354 [Quaeritorhiza haematococci]
MVDIFTVFSSPAPTAPFNQTFNHHAIPYSPSRDSHLIYISPPKQTKRKADQYLLEVASAPTKRPCRGFQSRLDSLAPQLDTLPTSVPTFANVQPMVNPFSVVESTQQAPASRNPFDASTIQPLSSSDDMAMDYEMNGIQEKKSSTTCELCRQGLPGHFKHIALLRSSTSSH